MIQGVNAKVATAKSIGSDLWSNGRGWILVWVAIGWFLSLGVRLVFPVLLPHIRAEFGFGLSLAGVLLTALWFAYAVGQLPGGILGDRIGEGNILLISTAVSTGTLFLLIFSSSPGLFFAGTVLFGLSTALYGPTRFTILSDIYSERDGTAIGLTLAVGNLGNTVLPFVAGIVAVIFSWRLGFGFVIPMFLVTILGIWHFIPNATSNSKNVVKDVSLTTLKRIYGGLAQRRVVLTTGLLMATLFAFHGFQGFYPTYLIEVKGLSPTQASMLFGLFFATGIVIQPITGASGDRFGAKRSLLVVQSFIIVGLILLPFVHRLIPLVLITILLGSFLGIGPIAHTFLVNALPSDMKGTGLGFLRTTFMTVASTGAVFVGFFGDLGYFDQAFLFLAGLTVAGFLMATFLSTPD